MNTICMLQVQYTCVLLTMCIRDKTNTYDKKNMDPISTKKNGWNEIKH